MRRLIYAVAALAILFAAQQEAFSQTGPDALVLYREGKYSEAAEVCIAEIAENEQNVESHVVLCWSLVAAKRHEEAVAWAEKGRQLSKYDPRLIEILAEAHFYLGRNEQALRFFQEYISYAPNGSRISLVYYFMGEIYLRQAKYRHADIAFSVALQLEKLNALWWVRLGYAREMAKDFRYSLEAYNQALALNPNLQDALRGRERATNHLN